MFDSVFLPGDSCPRRQRRWRIPDRGEKQIIPLAALAVVATIGSTAAQAYAAKIQTDATNKATKVAEQQVKVNAQAVKAQQALIDAQATAVATQAADQHAAAVAAAAPAFPGLTVTPLDVVAGVGVIGLVVVLLSRR